jgi:FtsP/CotA-like multicopper oxidase with cupredoxin domain
MQELPRRGLLVGATAAVSMLGGTAPLALAQGQPRAQATAASRPELREPVVLASKDGVLELRLSARQGEVKLDTVARPVKNFLLFDYELIRGTASDGRKEGRNLYPAPTLQVFPGERLVVHFENGLSGLTIRDFYNPAYTANDKTVPIYPEQLTESPLNLHTHGLHVSPKGNADNVMLHMPAGTSNSFTYDIPKAHPQGAYWYHSHLHMLTTAHVYTGMVGLLVIGRLDGGLPVVTEKRIPVRNMMLQYNYVFDRAGGSAQLNNPYWPQFVSTIVPPRDGELAKGTYRPLLTPTNFTETQKGTRYTTVWYAGPLSINNRRGAFQYIPTNLMSFTAAGGRTDLDMPADPSLPDDKRDMQFTVNGQFQPVVRSKPGQTEIWVLSNVSDIAYINVQLTETATGRHPPIAIVGQDGEPYGAVEYPPTDNGTRLLIPPASRFAIAVTMPARGDLILEMPDRGGGARTMTMPGVLYTNDGTDNPPAVLGSLTVLPSAISYADGFFVFPTQVLARATAPQGSGAGVTVPFAKGQKLGGRTPFADLSRAAPDVTRKIMINGGFLNDLVTKSDAKAFVYAFDGAAFPNMPLIQARLNSIEEWQFLNHNNDEHPIHVHVNDFQVTSYFDPTTGLRTGPDKFFVDNANVPAPVMMPDETVVQAGYMAMRTRFDDFIGLYVMHCHRLNHEDNGLMALVNVIPAISAYAVVVPGGGGKATTVRVLDGNGDKLIATVTPFPGHEGSVSVALGDLDGDGVLDLVVGAGKDHAPEIVAYSGKAAYSAELARFQAFGSDARGGVSVAAAQIDGTTSDNIIVGSGLGMASEIKVYGARLPKPGSAPPLFTSFAPYEGDSSGVSLATGFVDFGTGRNSIVSAPGPGSAAEVKVFVFPLLKQIGAAAVTSPQPDTTATLKPFGDEYRGGVSLATGWLAGNLGGAKRIVVGQLADQGQVKVFSSGSALDGGPAMYLHNPAHHHHAEFREIASFAPFEGTAGVRVATTSTTTGADLLVSGISAQGAASVARYDFARPDAKATTVQAVKLGDVAAASAGGNMPTVLAGD